MTSAVLRASALVTVLSLSAGCYQVPSTELHLRDPSLVAVQVETPDGTQEVLPAGRQAADVELPRTEPPYLGTALFEAHVLRPKGGGVTLRCDACLGHPLEKVVPADGFVQYAGLASDRIQWDGGQLLMRYTHLYSGPGRYISANPAYRVWLVTPLSNVTELRQRVTSHGADVSLLWSIVATAAFTSILVVGASNMASHGGGAPPLAVAALSLGIVGDVFSLPLLGMAIGSTVWEAQHPSTDDVLYPPVTQGPATTPASVH